MLYSINGSTKANRRLHRTLTQRRDFQILANSGELANSVPLSRAPVSQMLENIKTKTNEFT